MSDWWSFENAKSLVNVCKLTYSYANRYKIGSMLHLEILKAEYDLKQGGGWDKKFKKKREEEEKRSKPNFT